MGRLDGSRGLDRLVRRETRILAILSVVAVVGFFATRAVAAHNQRIAVADAARWHAIGAERLRAGQADAAVDAFRTAARIDREDRGHRLALADALQRSGDAGAALDVLLRLREGYAEDVEVNVTLARLEAARGDVDDAVRYYQTAILGVWQPARIAERRTLRVELIQLLLAHGAPERALAEALKLSGEIPDTPADHVRVGQLLLRAGSPARALDQFRAALAGDPRNRAAIAGRHEATEILAEQPRQGPQ